MDDEPHLFIAFGVSSPPGSEFRKFFKYGRYRKEELL